MWRWIQRYYKGGGGGGGGGRRGPYDPRLPRDPRAPRNTAYVDFDRATGKYYAVFNGRRYGPFNSSSEAWDAIRRLGG